MKLHIIPASMRHLAVKALPPDRAKITLIDRSNPLSHQVALAWTDATHKITDFDLSVLGKVDAVQDDLLACPPRGWAVLDGECLRRPSSYVKLLSLHPETKSE